MSALVVTALGACAGMGVLLIIAAFRGQRLLPAMSGRLPATMSGGRFMIWLLLGLFAGAGVLLATGWPVAAVAAGVFTTFLPSLIGGRGSRKSFIDRTEAIANWTELIRDNLAGAAGLEQALLVSARRAPEPIHAELDRFRGRLDAQVPLGEALARLGEDLDHPSADMVVVAVAKASRMEVRDLGPLLTRLSESIRADVRMRLRVEVSRARIRTSARIIVGFTLFIVAFLVVFATELLEPYDSPGGQLWLCVVVATFVGAGWLIHHYGKLEMPVRFSLQRAGADGGVEREVEL